MACLLGNEDSASEFESKASLPCVCGSDQHETRTRISAYEEPISKIFSSEYQFSIPDYQGPYSWAIEQALQLLEDLEDALDH